MLHHEEVISFRKKIFFTTFIHYKINSRLICGYIRFFLFAFLTHLDRSSQQNLNVFLHSFANVLSKIKNQNITILPQSYRKLPDSDSFYIK